MKTLFKLFFCLSAFYLTGCATIISGTKQNITINTTPSGANVIVDGNNIGVTPLFTSLQRKNTHFIKLELNGYQPLDINISQSFNPWFLGNILIGGLIGIVVDAATGAVYKLSPEQINANLYPTATSSTSKEGIYISVQLKADPNWTKIGQMTKLN